HIFVHRFRCVTQRRVAAFVFDVRISAARQQLIHHFEIAARGRGNQNGPAIGVLCVWIHSGVQEGIDRHHVSCLCGSEKTLLVKVVSSQLQYALRCFARGRLRTGSRASGQHEQRTQQTERYFLHGITTARLILTGFSGFSPSTGAWLIASATSMPFVTVPNAENLLSRCGPGPTRMKKCVVPLFGSSVRAIDTMPRTCFTRPGSSGSLRLIRFASSALHFSLVDKLPPWITKPFTTRLNVVVSSAPVALRLRKFLTASGATSGINAISIAPSSVSSVTHWLAIFSTVAPSNGSAVAAGSA